MKANQVHRDNISDAVNSAFNACEALLVKSQDANLHRDLTVALQSLELIRSELSGRSEQRPRNQRSGIFIRYVIDENDELAMDSTLKDVIIKIEDVYNRC